MSTVSTAACPGPDRDPASFVDVMHRFSPGRVPRREPARAVGRVERPGSQARRELRNAEEGGAVAAVRLPEA
ncbi:hypothetical protein GCM10010277_23740 [Streptomyces longisporoflavus]|nr:hypothetical protein GCM10010277_23740 [Streptomyces longisporoflavus]